MIPVTGAFLRLARLAAVALAEDAGFGHEDVDDLRIAVDELTTLLAHHGDAAHPVELTLCQLDGAVTVRGQRRAKESETIAVSDLVRRIVDAATDGWSLTTEEGTHRFDLVKRAPRSYPHGS